VPCLKVLRKAGDCFGWALRGFSTLFVIKFYRDAVKNNAEFGLGLEKVTIIRGTQGLAERILDPELTEPCRMMLWVRNGHLRRLSNQRCLEEMVAKQTDMCVSNELTNTAFDLPLGAEKTPGGEIARMAHATACDMRGWLEQFQIICHSHGLKLIRPSNFHSTHAEEETHKESGL